METGKRTQQEKEPVENTVHIQSVNSCISLPEYIFQYEPHLSKSS